MVDASDRNSIEKQWFLRHTTEKSGIPMDILFVPGLNCTDRLFAPQIEGLGGRAKCHVADHSAADTMEEIAAAILAAAPPRFALVGLSMGGYVAYEILRQQPQRVTRVALLDTRAMPDTPEDAERRLRTIELARGGQFDQLHAILWQRLVHPSRLSDTALESVVTGMMRETGAERFIRQQTAVLNRRDYQPVLSKISVPTVIMVGADDLITPPEHALQLHRAISGSRYIEIAHCGHLSTLERPAEVNAALIPFLLEETEANS
jgi:pimeloyl-ACP methyl ester carboxylesterase